MWYSVCHEEGCLNNELTIEVMKVRGVDKYDHLFEIIIVGDSGVGKTAILCRYADDDFSTAYVKTIGVDIGGKFIFVSGRQVKLLMWDTAGDPDAQTITQKDYKRSHAIIVVYDPGNESSIASLQGHIQAARDNAGEDVPIFLVANKKDLVEGDVEKPADDALRDLPFHVVSAKTDEGIDDLFVAVANVCVERLDANESAGAGADAAGGGLDAPASGVSSHGLATGVCEKLEMYRAYYEWCPFKYFVRVTTGGDIEIDKYTKGEKISAISACLGGRYLSAKQVLVLRHLNGDMEKILKGSTLKVEGGVDQLTGKQSTEVVARSRAPAI